MYIYVCVYVCAWVCKINAYREKHVKEVSRNVPQSKFLEVFSAVFAFNIGETRRLTFYEQYVSISLITRDLCKQGMTRNNPLRGGKRRHPLYYSGVTLHPRYRARISALKKVQLLLLLLISSSPFFLSLSLVFFLCIFFSVFLPFFEHDSFILTSHYFEN